MNYEKMLSFKLLDNLVIIINAQKFLAIDVPEWEKSLLEEGYDRIQAKVFMIFMICGKMAELSELIYYFAFPMILFILKNDDKVLIEIGNIIRLVRSR